MVFFPRNGVYWIDMCDYEEGKIDSMPLPNSRYYTESGDLSFLVKEKPSAQRYGPLPVFKRTTLHYAETGFTLPTEKPVYAPLPVFKRQYEKTWSEIVRN